MISITLTMALMSWWPMPEPVKLECQVRFQLEVPDFVTFHQHHGTLKALEADASRLVAAGLAGHFGFLTFTTEPRKDILTIRLVAVDPTHDTPPVAFMISLGGTNVDEAASPIRIPYKEDGEYEDIDIDAERLPRALAGDLVAFLSGESEDPERDFSDAFVRNCLGHAIIARTGRFIDGRKFMLPFGCHDFQLHNDQSEFRLRLVITKEGELDRFGLFRVAANGEVNESYVTLVDGIEEEHLGNLLSDATQAIRGDLRDLEIENCAVKVLNVFIHSHTRREHCRREESSNQ